VESGARFDHLISPSQDILRDRQTQSLRGLEIDHQFEFGRLFDRQIGGIGTSQKLDQPSGRYISGELDDARAIGGEPSLVGGFRPLVCWKAQCGRLFEDKPTLGKQSGDASTFTASTLEIRAALIASIISSGLLIRCTAS